jgi:hypothetical protein
MGSTPLYLY